MPGSPTGIRGFSGQLVSNPDGKKDNNTSAFSPFAASQQEPSPRSGGLFDSAQAQASGLFDKAQTFLEEASSSLEGAFRVLKEVVSSDSSNQEDIDINSTKYDATVIGIIEAGGIQLQKLRTCGDGACLIHALLGKFDSARESIFARNAQDVRNKCFSPEALKAFRHSSLSQPIGKFLDEFLKRDPKIIVEDWLNNQNIMTLNDANVNELVRRSLINILKQVSAEDHFLVYDSLIAIIEGQNSYLDVQKQQFQSAYRKYEAINAIGSLEQLDNFMSSVLTKRNEWLDANIALQMIMFQYDRLKNVVVVSADIKGKINARLVTCKNDGTFNSKTIVASEDWADIPKECVIIHCDGTHFSRLRKPVMRDFEDLSLSNGEENRIILPTEGIRLDALLVYFASDPALALINTICQALEIKKIDKDNFIIVRDAIASSCNGASDDAKIAEANKIMRRLIDAYNNGFDV